MLNINNPYDDSIEATNVLQKIHAIQLQIGMVIAHPFPPSWQLSKQHVLRVAGRHFLQMPYHHAPIGVSVMLECDTCNTSWTRTLADDDWLFVICYPAKFAVARMGMN